jgi:hypothetical protein
MCVILPESEAVFGVNFIAYGGYIKQGKPPFLIREFAPVIGKVRLPFLFSNPLNPKVQGSGLEGHRS